jgi:hypothetical protein
MLAILPGQVDAEIDKEIAKLRGQGMVIDSSLIPDIRAASVRAGQLIGAVTIAMGVAFIVFGFLVHKYPVPITAISLILYVGALAIFGWLDPSTLVQGWLIKILFIGGLVKALKAAVAYQQALSRQAIAPVA